MITLFKDMDSLEAPSLNKILQKNRIFLLIILVLFLQGCSTIPYYRPLPKQLEDRVEMPGLPNVRAWGDVPSAVLEKSAIESSKQELAASNGKLEPVVNGLALSGGGEDGAFGAGLLCGWTKAGTRPNFRLVTGISTGSLIAPLVFLGPAYDDKLKLFYTTISDKDIYEPNNPFVILFSLANIKALPSLASNRPLARLITKIVDAQMLNAIAAEHLKGRRLLIGTSQLNAQRLVIWDMGAIAASGSPRALELFRKILIASASLPVSFPPQYFKVEAAGKQYTEMHVDGGVETQVMLFENALVPFALENKWPKGKRRIRKLYIIRNQKVHPEWAYVKPELKDIALKAIDSLTQSQSISGLYRLYLYSVRDDFDYNLAYIPEDFKVKSASQFDNAYMKKLFALGYEMGRNGYPWHKYPPGFEPKTKLGEKVSSNAS
jgi:hypothetical protein